MRPEVIVAGFPETAIVRAPAMVLSSPISFWGGVSASDGRLLDPPFNEQGRSVSGTALFIRELRGSSSASSVLLELIYRGLAPAAIILDAPDAILALGAIVGREMGWPTPPILRLPAAEQARVPDGAWVVITTEVIVLDDDRTSNVRSP
jgi:predicted aconitase with swiveling domain